MRYKMQMGKPHVAGYVHRKDAAILHWLTLHYRAWSALCLSQRLKICSVISAYSLHQNFQTEIFA